jgi:tripartite-type tricarboxylate transporter receptor subunit TctC
MMHNFFIDIMFTKENYFDAHTHLALSITKKGSPRMVKKACLVFFVALILFGSGEPCNFCIAAGYPDHPIQLVVPYPAGSGADITARMLIEELDKILGSKIIPSNKPGASSVLGTDAVIRGKKDGYTLLYGSSAGFVYAPVANPEVLHYDPVKDAEPLGFHYFFPSAVVVRPDASWKTFSQLIEYAKKNPNKIRVSTTGVGSGPHFALEIIQSLTGTSMTHVPFEGGEAVLTALLGGHVEATVDAFSKVKPHADAGKMRMLLTTNKLPRYPDVPTITELGYKQNLPGSWFALFSPAGIPEDVRRVLAPAVEKAIRATKPRIDQMGGICEYKAPSEVTKMIEQEYARALEVAIKIGLRRP